MSMIVGQKTEEQPLQGIQIPNKQLATQEQKVDSLQGRMTKEDLNP